MIPQYSTEEIKRVKENWIGMLIGFGIYSLFFFMGFSDWRYFPSFGVCSIITFIGFRHWLKQWREYKRAQELDYVLLKQIELEQSDCDGLEC